MVGVITATSERLTCLPWLLACGLSHSAFSFTNICIMLFLPLSLPPFQSLSLLNNVIFYAPMPDFMHLQPCDTRVRRNMKLNVSKASLWSVAASLWTKATDTCKCTSMYAFCCGFVFIVLEWFIYFIYCVCFLCLCFCFACFTNKAAQCCLMSPYLNSH